jgi:hypothetical protein
MDERTWTNSCYKPLTLDEMVEAIGSVLPEMNTTPLNLALFADYYQQLTELLVDNGDDVLGWLKELQSARSISCSE